MYAVVSSGGKQYRVEPGATLDIERLDGEPDSRVTFDRVLLLADGKQVEVGNPTVSGASVAATVLGPERGAKVVVFKFRPKVHYRRRTGHRQWLTRVRIDEISAPGFKPAARATAEARTSSGAKRASAAKSRAARAPAAKRGSTKTKAGSKARE
jgi:large subunit ribosomal protein L21